MSKKLVLKNELLIVLIILTLLLITSCKAQEDSNDKKKSILSNAKVTFIELGSVNCIPCKQMQPVMRAVEKKYGDQINVIFYDVWQPEQKHYAMEYKIKLIPTQVFLDENGKEFFRHEGFFPEAEIDRILEKHGLN
ncbi:hypothetical protein MNBD_IGNAVI01-3084 [hydrothermal vent metagenome]|uniref:Thioredoxin domain-containing protein n=1 Tax=hydrothermal vent metagenome TaxID=652676 RepID=A0A3B1CEU1_9ZZZZ